MGRVSVSELGRCPDCQCLQVIGRGRGLVALLLSRPSIYASWGKLGSEREEDSLGNDSWVDEVGWHRDEGLLTLITSLPSKALLTLKCPCCLSLHCGLQVRPEAWLIACGKKENAVLVPYPHGWWT